MAMAEEAKKEKKKTKSDEREMNFLDHLGELRMRIIWSLVALIIASIGVGVLVFEYNLIDLILLNLATQSGLDLQNLKPFGQPFLFFKVTIVGGLIVAFPFMLYQLWKFIAPGLYDKEKGWVRTITFFTTLCFLTGVAFAYFVMIPSMLSFAASFGSEKIKNIIDINEYFSFLTTLILAAGLLFELPMVSFVLARVGILTPKMMRKYRRHGIVVILILAAILTPTPDPVSQMIFASPLFILYELSIFIAKIGERKYHEA